MLRSALEKTPVIYVTRDIERAIGLPLDTPQYFIIANSTSFAKRLAKTHTNIFLIEEQELLDTWDLLQHPFVISYINKISNARILVFKNTKQIETTCRDAGWTLINPPAMLSDAIEPKISQITWLDGLVHYLPAYTVGICSRVSWNGTPFILQFNRSHTGNGTMLITSEEQLRTIQHTFPNRVVRTATYIVGPLFTNNNCVTDTDVLIGNISYQITGMYPFTDRAFATIGNDWVLPTTLLNKAQHDAYVRMATDIGNKLRADGWRGLFGIDVVMDEKTGTLYLLEINARQPASTSYESYLQQLSRTQTQELTMFEAHILSLLQSDCKGYVPTTCHAGAQIIIRGLTDAKRTEETIEQMKKNIEQLGHHVIEYQNTTPGSDLLRIQTTQGIMTDHGIFNEKGEAIRNCVTV